MAYAISFLIHHTFPLQDYYPVHWTLLLWHVSKFVCTPCFVKHPLDSAMHHSEEIFLRASHHPVQILHDFWSDRVFVHVPLSAFLPDYQATRFPRLFHHQSISMAIDSGIPFVYSSFQRVISHRLVNSLQITIQSPK